MSRRSNQGSAPNTGKRRDPVSIDSRFPLHRLLKWYHAHKRILPWREEPEIYRVWVSEVMLQQTRVETVIPYFQRFVRNWPDIGALARASEEEILKAWEGLGYYSRARNLRRAAGGGDEGIPRPDSGGRGSPSALCRGWALIFPPRF